MKIVKIIKKEKIKIAKDYIVTEEEYKKSSNKEELIKDKFVSILKDNVVDNSAIKLVDLKKRYETLLPESLQKDDKVSQILKNVIGSNKNNTTHFLRNPNVDWYYCENTSKGYIEVNDEQKKPIQLPKELETAEKKGSKKYYVFYSSVITDSLISTAIEASENNKCIESKNYDNYDFKKIQYKKIDYVQKQRETEELGRIGEEYVVDVEKELLKKINICKEPIWVSQKNDSLGFDILSYRKDPKGNIKNYYIEVKTTNGSLYTQFYISNNELNVSSEYCDSYALYRVYNAGDKTQIKHEVYEGDINKNKSLKKKRTNDIYTYSVIK